MSGGPGGPAGHPVGERQRVRHAPVPSCDGLEGSSTTNGSDVLGNKEISFGLIMDYGHDLLRVPQSNQLIDHSFQGTFQFNYGLFNQVVVGVDMPVDLMSGGTQSAPNGAPLFVNQWGPQKLDEQGRRLPGRARQVADHARRARLRPRRWAPDRGRPGRIGEQRRGR